MGALQLLTRWKSVWKRKSIIINTFSHNIPPSKMWITYKFIRKGTSKIYIRLHNFSRTRNVTQESKFSKERICVIHIIFTTSIRPATAKWKVRIIRLQNKPCQTYSIHGCCCKRILWCSARGECVCVYSLSFRNNPENHVQSLLVDQYKWKVAHNGFFLCVQNFVRFFSCG
jgi:hypothetical protein